MKATVRKWGNSLALRIPRSFADDADVKEGSRVETPMVCRSPATPSIFWAAAVLMCFCAFPSWGLDFTVSYEPGERYRMLERSDLRRYEGGRFVGLSYREVRGILNVTADDAGMVAVVGDYFVLE